MARPAGLEPAAFCLEAVRPTLPNLARGVANRADTASWDKFPQTTFSFLYCHLLRNCRCFPRFALHFRDSAIVRSAQALLMFLTIVSQN